MTKEQYLAYENQVQEIKQKRKEDLTQQERKILKTEKGQMLSFGTAIFGCALMASCFFFLGAYFIHYGVTTGKMLEENEAEFETFKAEQIQKLNEEFDNGKGFSTKEYSEKLKQLEYNAVHDFFTTAVSIEVKMEYQKQDAIDKGLLYSAVALVSSGTIVGASGVLAGNVYLNKEKKFINEVKKEGQRVLPKDEHELER